MAANDLTTLPEAKAWLGITGSSSDSVLTRLVTAVSSAVQARIGYQVLSKAYTETRHGNGKRAMLLAAPRISAVSALSIDGIAVAARSSVTGSGYTFDEDFLFLVGQDFPVGVLNVVVAYTAGFAATPTDLEQAVLEIIQLKSELKERGGVSSKTLAGETISFFRDVSRETLSTIDSYRRVLAP